MNNNYVTYLNSKKRSDNTIDAYRKAIDDCLMFIGKSENEITQMDLMNWQAHISNMSSASVAQKVSAVKSYFKFCKTYNITKVNPAIELEPPSIHSKPKKYMSMDDVHAMISSCRSFRDKAIILTYATTGMRHAELSSITMDSWNNMIVNGVNYITINGKGNKERNVYFNQQTIDAIMEYLKYRKVDSMWLFSSLEGNQIPRNNMSHMLKTTAKRAGIAFADEISNHSMRAACASIMSENGIPVAVIRDTLGHSSIEVTSRYIKTNENQIKSANQTMIF